LKRSIAKPQQRFQRGDIGRNINLATITLADKDITGLQSPFYFLQTRDDIDTDRGHVFGVTNDERG
jgi:hypothetical protein